MLIVVFMKYLDFPIRFFWAMRGCSRRLDDDSNSNTVDSPASTTSLLTRYSYGAILLSPLVSLAVELRADALLLDDNESVNENTSSSSSPVLMTCVIGVVNIFASWMVAWAFIRFVPGVG